jgi:hypothetical protein
MPGLSFLNDVGRLIDPEDTSLAFSKRFLSEDPTGERAYSGAWNAGRSQYQQNSSYLRAMIMVYPKFEEPFTQSNLVETEEGQVKEIIFQIKISPSILCRQIGNKLLTLFNDAKEDDPNNVGISLGSLKNFSNFIKSHPDLKCPSLSLSPDYNIYCSWRSKQNRVFSVHFLSGSDVRFVLFKQNDRHPDRQVRLSGTATIDVLKETVESHGVWNWISE